MDAWARGTLVVLLAYVVVVVVGLVLGNKPRRLDRLPVAVIVDCMERELDGLNTDSSVLSDLNGPIYVINVEDSLVGRAIARQYERSRQLVELIIPSDECVQGIRALGTVLAAAKTGVVVYLCPDNRNRS